MVLWTGWRYYGKQGQQGYNACHQARCAKHKKIMRAEDSLCTLLLLCLMGLAQNTIQADCELEKIVNSSSTNFARKRKCRISLCPFTSWPAYSSSSIWPFKRTTPQVNSTVSTHCFLTGGTGLTIEMCSVYIIPV